MLLMNPWPPEIVTRMAAIDQQYREDIARIDAEVAERRARHDAYRQQHRRRFALRAWWRSLWI